MCTTITISTLFFLFLVQMRLLLLIESLPLLSQEREAEAEFARSKGLLGVLMDLSVKNKLEITTNHPQLPPATLPTSIQLEHYSTNYIPIARKRRSTHFTSPVQEAASDISLTSTQTLNEMNSFDLQKSNELNRPRLVEVSISSSVGETHRIYSPRTTTTEMVKLMGSNPSDYNFQSGLFPSEDHQSYLAENGGHELNVEEPKVISRNLDVSLVEELPANVQIIPVIKKLSDFEKTSELFKELSREKLKDKLPSFHHTVIYHDTQSDKTASRSLTYSTLVQNLSPQSPLKAWRKTNNPQVVEPTENAMVEYQSKDYFINFESSDSLGMKDTENATEEYIEPTEVAWKIQRNALNNQENVPIVYTQSEENYEIDETVSVQTNGRIHGVQPSESTQGNESKPTATSKNGYIIEGRKERRYRVEERTSDGFIVGEFGIVNRDDGLLRGVRYTAEETINPKLIYDTLMKFLSL